MLYRLPVITTIRILIVLNSFLITVFQYFLYLEIIKMRIVILALLVALVEGSSRAPLFKMTDNIPGKYIVKIKVWLVKNELICHQFNLKFNIDNNKSQPQYSECDKEVDSHILIANSIYCKNVISEE